MTCYMRHMGWLFEALELENTPENRRRVDAAIRQVLVTSEDDRCPQLWAAIKALDPGVRDGLPDMVRGQLR